MAQVILPATSNKIEIVSVGDEYHIPSPDEMKQIINLFYTEPVTQSDIKKATQYRVVIDKCPEKLNAEFVFLIENGGHLSLSDIESFNDILQKVQKDKTPRIFVWGGLKMKRIKKLLLPFL